MRLHLSDCITFEIGPPQLLLRAASGLLRLYPAVLKASMVLDRLVR